MMFSFMVAAVKNLLAYDPMAYPLGLRELDGQIALSVLAHQTDPATFASDASPAKPVDDWPFALVMDTKSSMKDVVQFRAPDGVKWIMMADAKVPYYTTSYDAAIKLLPQRGRWSIADTGLVKLKIEELTWKHRSPMTQISLCVVGLTALLKLRGGVEL